MSGANCQPEDEAGAPSRSAGPRAPPRRPASSRRALPAGLELRGLRAEAAGVRQQEGAAGEPQLLPRGRGAAVRLQDLLPRVSQALPGQRVPRAALHLRQRRHARVGRRLLQPARGRGRRPLLQQPNPLPFRLHLAGERHTCGRAAKRWAGVRGVGLRVGVGVGLRKAGRYAPGSV